MVQRARAVCVHTHAHTHTVLAPAAPVTALTEVLIFILEVAGVKENAHAVVQGGGGAQNEVSSPVAGSGEQATNGLASGGGLSYPKGILSLLSLGHLGHLTAP